jgi:hypothetical protein
MIVIKRLLIQEIPKRRDKFELFSFEIELL